MLNPIPRLCMAQALFHCSHTDKPKGTRSVMHEVSTLKQVHLFLSLPFLRQTLIKSIEKGNRTMTDS